MFLPVEEFACVDVNQLHRVLIPYRTGIGPDLPGERTEGSAYLPEIVDVGKLVAGDLLLVGGASVVGVFEWVEVRVGVEPAEEVGGPQGHMGAIAKH